MTTPDRLRFETPLYSVAEAARIVDVPPTTLATWAKGYVRRPKHGAEVTGDPVITSFTPRRRSEPTIPFVGLAEALVLAAIRQSGVPMQRIRPALLALDREIGLDHVLASHRLYTDGAEVLFDYGEARSETSDGDAALELVAVRNGQHVFTSVVESYLQRIDYAPDGYTRLIRLPAYRRADVIADPERSFGSPIFARRGARVSDVLQRFWAGDTLEELAADYRVPSEQLEDVLRVASRRAA